MELNYKKAKDLGWTLSSATLYSVTLGAINIGASLKGISKYPNYRWSSVGEGTLDVIARIEIRLNKINVSL